MCAYIASFSCPGLELASTYFEMKDVRSRYGRKDVRILSPHSFLIIQFGALLLTVSQFGYASILSDKFDRQKQVGGLAESAT